MGSPPNRDGPSSSSSSITTGGADAWSVPVPTLPIPPPLLDADGDPRGTPPDPLVGDFLRCPVEPLLSLAADKLPRLRLGVRLSSALGDVAPDGRGRGCCVLGGRRVVINDKNIKRRKTHTVGGPV